MPKDIIILLDGTWNDPESGPNDTNIVRLREVIAKTLWQMNGSPVGDGSSAKSDAHSGVARHLVYYERGIGTDAFNRFRGGTFGDGLARNIRRAYKFLSETYEMDDRIFIFGFSRGAYTARSLVGLISSAGLLRKPYCTSNLEASVWHYYRTHPHDRDPATQSVLSQYTHDPKKFSISCLGVFDTVGALGIPLRFLWRFNRSLFQFHDVECSGTTEVNLHALAIDEHREAFQATLWRRPRFVRTDAVTEQAWFMGSHCDVGGGRISAYDRGTGECWLDDISLDWLIRRVLKYFPDFPAKPLFSEWPHLPNGRMSLYEARAGIYRSQPFALRALGNRDVKLKKRRWERIVGRDRHGESYGELIHVSVLDSLGIKLGGSSGEGKYEPRNVSECLPFLLQIYEGIVAITEPQFRVVDWSGDILDPNDSRKRDTALTLIKSAMKRLGMDVPSNRAN